MHKSISILALIFALIAGNLQAQIFKGKSTVTIQLDGKQSSEYQFDGAVSALDLSGNNCVFFYKTPMLTGENGHYNDIFRTNDFQFSEFKFVFPPDFDFKKWDGSKKNLKVSGTFQLGAAKRKFILPVNISKQGDKLLFESLFTDNLQSFNLSIPAKLKGLYNGTFQYKINGLLSPLKD